MGVQCILVELGKEGRGCWDKGPRCSEIYTPTHSLTN